MKEKLTKITSITIIAVIIMIQLTANTSHALETKIPIKSKKAIFYSVTINNNDTKRGTLYWTIDDKLNHFLSNKNANQYNPKNEVTDGKMYNFSTLISRYLIPIAAPGYYFQGFYGQNNEKLNIKKINLDIIKIVSKGFIFYDCIESKNNAKYDLLTNSKYKELKKTEIKLLYGVSRYKIIDNIDVYSLPKKSSSYSVIFSPKIKNPLTVERINPLVLGEMDFVIKVTNPSDGKLTFKSSNPRILSVNKYNGLVKIKGEGISTIIIKSEATDKYNEETVKFDIEIYPPRLNIIDLKSSHNSTLDITLSKDYKASGYEIELSENNSFTKGIKTKRCNSKDKNCVTIKNLKSGKKYYVHARAFKKSKGKNLYSEYSKIRSVVVK